MCEIAKGGLFTTKGIGKNTRLEGVRHEQPKQESAENIDVRLYLL